jgi:hypothetical protein
MDPGLRRECGNFLDMKFLTKIECEKLASQAGVEFRPRQPTRLPTMKHAGRFIYDLPRDPLARRWPIARTIGSDLAQHVGRFTLALLWFYSYPFWWNSGKPARNVAPPYQLAARPWRDPAASRDSGTPV